MSGKVIDENSGVYLGVLQEDMIDTVTRTKRPFIDVLIEGIFSEDSDYPYTYVPVWGMILNLRKGDKVLVQFNQNNLLYPILFKNPNEVDPSLYKKFPLPPAGATVSFPSDEDTLSSYKFSDTSYLIVSASYTCLRQQDSCVLLTDNKAYITASDVSLLAQSGQGGSLTLEASELKLITPVGVGATVDIGNTTNTLGSLFSEFLDTVIGMSTVGSPATHTVSPTDILKLNELKEKVGATFK